MRDAWNAWVARWGTLYVALFGVRTLVGLVPAAEPVHAAYLDGWAPLVRAAGGLFGAQDVGVVLNGSGDTIFEWLFMLVNAVVAAIVAGVWTIADRRAGRRPLLRAPSQLLVRHLLAGYLIAYGGIKVFATQFGDLAPELLETPFGEASPQVLLWTFMAYSDAYETFAGLVELVAGLLLMSPRTTTTGALLSTAAMTQVVMLNFCYDVPVKLLASHLWLASIWLVMLDGRRLLDMFVFGRAVPAAVFPDWPRSASRRRTVRALTLGYYAVLVLGYALFFVETAPEDAEARAAARAHASAFPLTRHRVRLVDDRTSMWN